MSATAAVLTGLSYAAPIFLPYIMDALGSVWDKKTTSIEKGPDKQVKGRDVKGRFNGTTTIVPGEEKIIKGPTNEYAKGLQGLARFGEHLVPSVLGLVGNAAETAGATAGATANALANVPSAIVNGLSTPEQRAAYGGGMIQALGNVASLAGEPLNTAATGAGKALGGLANNLAAEASRHNANRDMLEFIEQQSNAMKDNPLPSSAYDLLGKGVTFHKMGIEKSDERIKNFDANSIRQLLEELQLDEKFNTENNVDEDVLKGYAEHIHNYLYTYNNEALKVDPTTDTNKEHIGVMAQDLEKVNPATVIDTPSGYKAVDTGRVALMNAGAIAELARRVEELEHGRD